MGYHFLIAKGQCFVDRHVVLVLQSLHFPRANRKRLPRSPDTQLSCQSHKDLTGWRFLCGLDKWRQRHRDTKLATKKWLCDGHEITMLRCVFFPQQAFCIRSLSGRPCYPTEETVQHRHIKHVTFTCYPSRLPSLFIL